MNDVEQKQAAGCGLQTGRAGAAASEGPDWNPSPAASEQGAGSGLSEPRIPHLEC